MQIIAASRNDLGKKVIFNMTEGASSNKMSDSVGEVIELKAWIIYETEDSKGNQVTALAVQEPNGIISSTISETFIRQFNKIRAFMGEDPFNIRVVSGTSNNGRQYITCEVV